MRRRLALRPLDLGESRSHKLLGRRSSAGLRDQHENVRRHGWLRLGGTAKTMGKNGDGKRGIADGSIGRVIAKTQRIRLGEWRDADQVHTG